MKDNFDVYNWKLRNKPLNKNSGEFNLYEWNKKRYLGELDIDQYDTLNVNKDDEGSSFNITRGGDDAKMGAELESDANVVGENKSHLEFLSKYLEEMYPNLRFDIREKPFDRIDVLGSQQDLADFGREMHGKKFGGGYEVFAVDDDDRGEVVRIVKSDSIMRNYENLNEASYMYRGYEDKHFDICPTAEKLRDRLKSGEFGKPDELDLGEWLYQHDVLFRIEKQLIKDGEGEPEDFKEARKAVDRIINLSRDLNIPGSELGYLKEHLDIIKGIIEYGTLTEKEVIKETLRFIKENNPEFTNEEIKAELQEIKELGKQLSEELCPKGKAYRKRRMAAGEKSSAYLSGRAVKVCKGQISGRKKRKKKK